MDNSVAPTWTLDPSGETSETNIQMQMLSMKAKSDHVQVSHGQDFSNSWQFSPESQRQTRSNCQGVPKETTTLYFCWSNEHTGAAAIVLVGYKLVSSKTRSMAYFRMLMVSCVLAYLQTINRTAFFHHSLPIFCYKKGQAYCFFSLRNYSLSSHFEVSKF